MIERRIGDRGVGFGAAIASRDEQGHRRVVRAGAARGPDGVRADPRVHRPPAGRSPRSTSSRRDDLITILTEPRNALTRQFQRFFEFDDIELVFAEDCLERDRRQGARARDRRPRPALDPRGDAARRPVRAALAPRRHASASSPRRRSSRGAGRRWSPRPRRRTSAAGGRRARARNPPSASGPWTSCAETQDASGSDSPSTRRIAADD